MSHVKSTFVTPVDLLRYTIDALENDPSEAVVDKGHPLDSYYAAVAALDAITGLLVAQTRRAYSGQ